MVVRQNEVTQQVHNFPLLSKTSLENFQRHIYIYTHNIITL